jgi:tetratricopeptide (TPR) repeat protein
LLQQGGRLVEAEASYRQALAQYDRLETDFPAYQGHKKNREATQHNLTGLLALRPFLEDVAETQEGHRLADASQYQAAADCYRQAIARHDQRRKDFPDQANHLLWLTAKKNRLAWFLVTCAEEQVRVPKEAVELARQAVAQAPQEGGYWNTLGAAYYRAGNWNECVTALEKSMHLRQGGDGFDWLFLAMASHQLKKPNEAEKWLNKSVEWIRQAEQGQLNNPLHRAVWQTHRREAELLRREATALLRPKPDAPK